MKLSLKNRNININIKKATIDYFRVSKINKTTKY